MVHKKDSLLAGKGDSRQHFDTTNLARAVRNALRPGLSAVAIGALGALGALGSINSVRAQQVTNASPDASNDLVEIVVTARRAALASADDRKKNSETMIDSVVADEAGLLPDNSVTEVLQRVAGVTMVRFASLGNPDELTGEGSGIQVRGLSGVDARLNGREVFSATGGQGLSFQDVTPELLAAVDVYKSATADLIEGGSGGQVDLRTHMPFDFDPGVKFQVTVNANYGDLAKKVDPGASFILSDHWTGPWGDFGALVDVAYSKLDSMDFFIRNEAYYQQNIGGTNYYIPFGFDEGFNWFSRKRTGEYAALQWAPTEDLQFGQTFFFSKYQQTSTGNGAFINNGGNGLVVDPAVSTFNAQNILISSPSLFTRNETTFSAVGASPMGPSGDDGVGASVTDTLDSSTTFHWKPAERWDLKGAFQFVNSVSDARSYDLFDNFPGTDGDMSLTESLQKPTWGIPASTQALNADPSQYFWSAHMDDRNHHDGEEHAANLDLKYDISDAGFFRSAQVGGRYSDRTEQDEDTSYNWSPFCEGWNGCNLQSLGTAPTVPSNITYQSFSNFFRGAINNPGGVYLGSYSFANQYNPWGNVAQLAPTCGTTSPPNNPSLKVNGCNGGQLNLAQTGYISPYTFGGIEQSFERSSDTALYGMLRFANDSIVRFDGNFGMRFVKIDNKSSGYFIQNGYTVQPGTLGTAGLFLPGPVPAEYRTGGRDTSRALPAFNIRFKVTDKIVVRAAYTVTLDEPSFNDLRANGSQGASATITTDPVTKVATLSDLLYSSTAGDPELRPTISHNTDLSFEWYPSPSTSGHLSLFYKTLNDTIIYGSTVYPTPFITSTGSTIIEPTQQNNDYNAPQTATIKGVEMGYRTFFDRLPSPFNGLGVEGNYTHINDNNPGNSYQDITGVYHHDTPIIGLSNNSFNLAGMFEKSQWSVRLAYNWRSKYLMTTNAASGSGGNYNYYASPGAAPTTISYALPIYADAYGQLDFGLAYRPTTHLTFSVDANNLTNFEQRTLMGGYPGGDMLVRSWFTADRRLLVSFRYKL